MSLPVLDEHPQDFCGLAAIYLKKDLSQYPKGGALYFLQKMLLQLQHRGQLSAGITIYNANKPDLLKTHKGNGLVNEVFAFSDTEKGMKLYDEFEGTIGIGHTRYATSGSDLCADAQPFERIHSRLWKWFSFAFNGNVANASHIRSELQSKNYHFRGNTDTEALMHLIAYQLGSDYPQSLETAFAEMATQLDGAYNIAFLNARGELCIVRDPHGFKPLCYIDSEDFFIAASESVALQPFVKHGMSIVDLKPGEMIRIHENKIIRSRFTPATQLIAHCMFEWVYFASAGSTMQGSSVYETRWRLGEELAAVEKMETSAEDWVVVNVPDTSKPAADGYAFARKLPSKEGLLRNRYVGRTFIQGGKWQDRVREKFTINTHVMEGKKVVLVEDSIVRGSTLRELVIKLKEEGRATEVHARISCPPILNPCFYGIDMTTFNELVAVKEGAQTMQRETVSLTNEQMQSIGKKLGADSLQFQTLDGLVRAMKLPESTLCTACITGKYPTPWGKELVKQAWERYQNQQSGRIYDA